MIALIFASLIGTSLWQTRRDLWQDAHRSSENVLLSVGQDIQRRFALFDVLLREAAGNLMDPALAATPAARQRVLDRAQDIGGPAGNVMLLDVTGKVELATGEAVRDAAGHAPSFLDRDFFAAHVTRPNLGLYIGRAFRGPAQEPYLALSRRLDDANGKFAGVLVAILHLEQVRALFNALERKTDDVLLLMRDDGVLLVREPDRGRTWQDFSGDSNYQQLMMMGKGSLVFTSSQDHIRRLYTFAPVDDLPLVLIAGLSVDEIMAPWRTRAVIAGIGTLVICVLSIAIAIALRLDLMQRAGSQAELVQSSLTDSLTGIANRRQFDDISAREWQRALRVKAPLAVLMIDIDRFKTVNDRLGHPAGDDVLRAIAQLIQHNLRRPGDFVARYGGEEFVALLPDTEIYGAQETAERIRSAIERDIMKGDQRITVSVGVAAVAASQQRSVSDVISAADRALYRAKEAGRNRVVTERLLNADAAPAPVA
ncbi:diguanylate cyclase [Xanthobacteraceae bacterium A53D]